MPDVAASCLPQVIAGNWKQRPEKCSSCQSPAELPFRYTCHTFNIPKVLFFLSSEIFQMKADIAN